jgi:hypothetical protein
LIGINTTSTTGANATARITVNASGSITDIKIIDVGSAFFGAIGFIAITCGVPLLPIVGLPARTGAMRWLIAIVGSAAIWWWVGQLSAARVRKLAVASWADWAKEFGLYAAALVLGVIFALLIAAKSLGAL